MNIDNIKNIKIKDFDYPLPDERIARHPIEQRDQCKMLVREPDATITHTQFNSLPQLLKPDTLMVCNNTKVINARCRFKKQTGAEIEVFCLEPHTPADYAVMFQTTQKCVWTCLVGNLKRWNTDTTLQKQITINNTQITLTAQRLTSTQGPQLVEFKWDNPQFNFAQIIEQAGYIPIPPYLNRASQQSDTTDYQTVYSRISGSVAAPTAGLHFTDTLLDKIKKQGIQTAELTLHVGAGTFQPVKTTTIGLHPMHTEIFTITQTLLQQIITALKQNRHIAAIGTTSVRTLESLPYIGAQIINQGIDITAGELHVDQWQPYNTDTNKFDTLQALQALNEWLNHHSQNSLTAATAIMIAPGFNWRIVDTMITNFHQPQSTLLLLVSSFVDGDWKEIYRQALNNNYRFLSYGDSTLLFRPKQH